MLLENMAMAFSAIRVNKMRSILTMLGIVIGIGSVISIVSIGDTMRSLFADIYKDVGLTQGYVQVMSWEVDDSRQSDMFTLDGTGKRGVRAGDRLYRQQCRHLGRSCIWKKPGEFRLQRD